MNRVAPGWRWSTYLSVLLTFFWMPASAKENLFEVPPDSTLLFRLSEETVRSSSPKSTSSHPPHSYSLAHIETGGRRIPASGHTPQGSTNIRVALRRRGEFLFFFFCWSRSFVILWKGDFRIVSSNNPKQEEQNTAWFFLFLVSHSLVFSLHRDLGFLQHGSEEHQPS